MAGDGDARARPTRVVLWGASGHAKVLHECLQQVGVEVVALFDNQPGLSSPLPGVPLYTGTAGFQEWRALGLEGIGFLVAIGGDRGRDRMAIHTLLEENGLIPVRAVHPTAFVAATVKLGDGSQVLAHATVCVDAVLGRQSIINTKASVDHETVVGVGAHIAPGATIAGCVEIGDYAMIGAGAVTLPRVKIGVDAVIGAGAVVTSDIPDRAVAYGNPARIVKYKE
jgi:sugar O-acyltransferase (sialic acid O-acetyltransferase NeuD family)